MGWWSDVLADAIRRSGRLADRVVLHALAGEAAGVRREVRLRRRAELRGDARGPHASRRSSTRRRTTCTSKRPAQPRSAGKHVFLDKPIANTIADARALTEACRDAGVVLALGYQRRRESHFRWIRTQIDDGVFGRLVNAEANISRDRLGKIDLTSWRYTAAGMPGGVMLQIGIHYTRRARVSDRSGQGRERPAGATGAARETIRTSRA